MRRSRFISRFGYRARHSISGTMLMRSREPFGSIAVRLGYVGTSDVVRALQENEARAAKGDGRLLTGLLMVELGMLTSEQVVSILAEHGDLEYSISGDALRLAARIAASTIEDMRVLCVTGGGEHETGTVARQLSVALALMGRGTVLFVDAKPDGSKGIAERTYEPSVFPQDAVAGFSNLLQRTATLEEAIIPTSAPSLLYLGPGEAVADYVALLLSEAFVELMATLRERHRHVILNSPPLLTSPHTSLIASRSDGVALVISAGKRRKTDVVEMKRVVDGLNVPTIGAVLYKEK